MASLDLGLCIWPNSVWAPTLPNGRTACKLAFQTTLTLGGRYTAAIELAQWPGCNRVELFAITRLRENACKLPAGRAKWGFWLPGVQISTLDSLALLPVMSRPAYSFFMALQA